MAECSGSIVRSPAHLTENNNIDDEYCQRQDQDQEQKKHVRCGQMEEGHNTEAREYDDDW